jgi:hypothetical protein
LKEVAKLISEKFDENAVVKKQRGSLGARDAILDAVRNDQNVILQLSRQAHTELTHQIACKSSIYLFLSNSIFSFGTIRRTY